MFILNPNIKTGPLKSGMKTNLLKIITVVLSIFLSIILSVLLPFSSSSTLFWNNAVNILGVENVIPTRSD